MSITATTADCFQGENAVRMFLEHTETKEYKERMVKDEVLFELSYWAGRLSKKIVSILKDPREALQKLNDEYGLNEKNSQQPLKDVLGGDDKVKEFTKKRNVIMEEELNIDLFTKKITQFKSTGAGGFALMGLAPFLEDDMSEQPKKKAKKEK